MNPLHTNILQYIQSDGFLMCNIQQILQTIVSDRDVKILTHAVIEKGSPEG